MVALDQSQLDALRHRLEQDRDSLRQQMEDLENTNIRADNQYDSSEFSGYGNHMAETGTEIYEQERSLAIEQSLQQQLDEVERALDKFDAGTYGICDNCGKEINPERLQALPQATLCIECKGRQEAQPR